MQWARQVLSQGAIRMKRIPRHRHTCLLSKQATPVARVAPGESVVFETWDALGGRVRSHKDALELSLPREMGNPATGPVYVEGARTGDTLGVEIIDIRLGDLGYGRVKSGGVIIDELKPPAANLTPIRNGMVRFNETLSFPVRPMVGVVGVAPRGDPVPTFYPGDHGGNMDVNAAITGSTVFLPVSTPGGLLAIGDVHARMGDGELNGGGLDIAARVKVQVTLHQRLGWRRPVIETLDVYCPR